MSHRCQERRHTLTAILPCNNIATSRAFYERLEELLGEVKQPENKPWGMSEFALSDPDETLVRIGWPTRLRWPG